MAFQRRDPMAAESVMALHFAFHLGSLVFAASLLRSACEQRSFIDGLYHSVTLGLVFCGIGFAVGEICRHLVEELVVREFAAAGELQKAGLSGQITPVDSTTR